VPSSQTLQTWGAAHWLSLEHSGAGTGHALGLVWHVPATQDAVRQEYVPSAHCWQTWGAAHSLSLAHPLLAPPEFAPPVLAPPALTPPEFEPPVLAPPAFDPAALTPPEFEPPVLAPPAALTPPEFEPPVLAPPALVPAALTPPEPAGPPPAPPFSQPSSVQAHSPLAVQEQVLQPSGAGFVSPALQVLTLLPVEPTLLSLGLHPSRNAEQERATATIEERRFFMGIPVREVGRFGPA
jgi:hypothetical protein